MAFPREAYERGNRPLCLDLARDGYRGCVRVEVRRTSVDEVAVETKTWNAWPKFMNENWRVQLAGGVIP